MLTMPFAHNPIEHQGNLYSFFLQKDKKNTWRVLIECTDSYGFHRYQEETVTIGAYQKFLDEILLAKLWEQRQVFKLYYLSKHGKRKEKNHFTNLYDREVYTTRSTYYAYHEGVTSWVSANKAHWLVQNGYVDMPVRQDNLPQAIVDLVPDNTIEYRWHATELGSIVYK